MPSTLQIDQAGERQVLTREGAGFSAGQVKYNDLGKKAISVGQAVTTIATPPREGVSVPARPLRNWAERVKQLFK